MTVFYRLTPGSSPHCAVSMSHALCTRVLPGTGPNSITYIVTHTVQHEFAARVLALGKPTVLVLMNAGAVAFDAEAAHVGPAPLAIIEAFYPGPSGGVALAQGIFGLHNRWGRLPYVAGPMHPSLAVCPDGNSVLALPLPHRCLARCLALPCQLLVDPCKELRVTASNVWLHGL